MNERIRLFAEQAGIELPNNVVDGVNGPGVVSEKDKLAKFAELIVGHAIECVRDVLRDDSDLSYVAASQVQKRLREFFGVEE